MQLVNNDDLRFSVGGFLALSCFPFSERGEDFRNMVIDFLAGRSRIRLRRAHAILESPTDGGWKVEARYFGMTWYGWRERIVFSDGERVG